MSTKTVIQTEQELRIFVKTLVDGLSDQAIEELFQSYSSGELDGEYDNEGSEIASINDLTTILKENGYEFENVYQHGGEGQGDEYYSIYKVSNAELEVYVQFNGWYASYHGSEYQEWFFVEAREETVINYYLI